VVQSSAAETMVRSAATALPLETGGILVGHHEDHAIVVTHALVIPAASATSTRYTRDAKEANRTLDRMISAREPGDPAGYVGEWHSHPGSSGISSTDAQSLREVAGALDTPIALIVVFPTRAGRTDGAIAARTRSGRVAHRKAAIQVVLAHLNGTVE
jgi:integrative and conjugative element protein (TIGR02256 family)